MKSGASVIAFVLESEQHRLPPLLTGIRSKFEIVYVDLRNLRLTCGAIRNAQPECVIHLAAAGVTDPFLSTELALRHNVTGTLNLITACFEGEAIRQPPQRFVVARTPGELSAIEDTTTLWAELRWAARAEGVVRLEDLLLRRTRLGLLLPDAGARQMKRIRSIVQSELAWEDKRWESELRNYTELWKKCYHLGG